MADTYMTMPKTFENLKYGDLQRYAKKFGIKANLKAEKLIDALTNYGVLNGLIIEGQDVRVIQNDISSESDTVIQNMASKESQSVRCVSPCSVKPGTVAVSKELESGKVFSVRDSGKAVSHREAEEDGSVSDGFNMECYNAAIVYNTDEKENSEKKQQVFFKESAIKIASTEYVCERRNKRKRSSDRKVVQDVEDVEVVFNLKENKRLFQMKTPDKHPVPKAAASSCRKRHNTYTVEDSKTQAGLGSVANSEAVSGVKETCAVQKISQIPRLNLPTKNRSSTVKTFTAQYWAKLHKRQFDQMDSLDVYMKKKTQRALSLLSPNHANVSVGKEKRIFAQQKKAALEPVNESSFVPTVFSTTAMNTNFRQMYQNQIPSVKKLQPEKTEGDDTTSVEAKVKAAEFRSTRKSLGTAFTVNPFSPAGNISSAQKPKFDLQASLSRPITWKPYVGKLKEAYIKDCRLDVKKVTVKTRDDRRREISSARARKRAELQNERRVIGNSQ